MRTVFIVLFIVSLGINIYFLVIRPEDEGTDDYFPVHCNDESRYDEKMGNGGGKGISIDNAREAVENYETENPEANRGFIFSKAAIDRLFDQDENANAIHVMLGIQEDKTVCIIGVNRETTIAIDITSEDRLIISETGCPDACMEL